MTTGTLRLVQGRPNPNAAGDAAVYLFCGDATAAPVTEILPAAGVALPRSSLPLPQPVQIRLFHFNDLHGQIAHFTPAGARPAFSRIVGGLRARKVEDPQIATLVISAGDDAGGVIFDELLGDRPATYQVHVGYQLYSQAGVALSVLGNHDLDKGAALLAHAIRQDAHFPILSANVTGSAALADGCYPAAFFIVKGVRIGFIGLTTPAQFHPDPDSPLRVTDPVAAVRHLLPALRPLCDVLIILSHLGYSLSQTSAGMHGAGDVELARSLPAGAVHLIIGGHTHTVLNERGLSAENIVNDIPIVQAGKFGQFVGEVNINVQAAATVTYARLHTPADWPIDEEFEREFVQPAVARVRPYRERILGRTAQEDDLGAEAVRHAFATGESALANFVADVLVSEARAHGYAVDLALVDVSNAGGGLPVGQELTFGDWFDLMPFADDLCLVRLSGRELVELLHDNTRRLDRPGQPHTERGFVHSSGQLRYTIHLGPSRWQASAADIRMDDQPIEELLERIFVIACGSFLRRLAAAWEAQQAQGTRAEPVEAAALRQAQGVTRLFDLRRSPWETTPLSVRDLLVHHITTHGGVLPEGGAKRDGRLRVLA